MRTMWQALRNFIQRAGSFGSLGNALTLTLGIGFSWLATGTTGRAQFGGSPLPPVTQPAAPYAQPAAPYTVPGASSYGGTVPPPPPANTTPASIGFGQPVGTTATPIYGAGVQPPTVGAPFYPPAMAPGSMNQPLPPLNPPWQTDPNIGFMGSSPFGYMPNYRDVPIDVTVSEGQTGRFSVGGSVNSDLGVAGNIILEERNFDLFRLPGRPSDLFNGAFRGAGQNFRLELVPGNLVQRYTVNWMEPSLFGYSPFSLAVGGFYFTRFYRDWSEQRLGGRAALGYDITPDLSLSTELRAEDVKVFNPRNNLVASLNDALGSNDVYTGRFRLAHNTRDSPFLPTEGHLLEMIYDQVFGEYDFPRGQINYSRYFLVRERADGSGRHTFTTAFRTGFAGVDQPIFENFFAGGFSTIRGFQFRGASPVESGIQVGGRFQFLGSLEYMFPVTADDMLRMVAFVDYGTVEKNIEINWNNFRVAPGIGFRIAVPALGPSPLAFDFAVPVTYADTDDRQVFSFNAGLTR